MKSILIELDDHEFEHIDELKKRHNIGSWKEFILLASVALGRQILKKRKLI